MELTSGNIQAELDKARESLADDVVESNDSSLLSDEVEVEDDASELSEPTVDDTQDEAEESDKEESGEQDAADESQSDEADFEYVKVADSDGRKKKLKIDYSDRKKIRQAYLQAAGMRKFQAERDQLRKEFEGVKPDLDAVQKINETYEKGGLQALVDLIGGEGSYQKHLQKELAKARIRESGSDEDIRELERQEATERERRELEALRREREEFLKQSQAEREESERSRIKSMVEPSFNKYRFAGKLGDSSRESTLDRMIWRDAREELQALADSGTQLTPAVVDREFRRAAAALGATVKEKAKLAQKKISDKKKREAAEHIQKPTSRSGRPMKTGSGDRAQLLNDLKTKSISEIMANPTLWDAL